MKNEKPKFFFKKFLTKTFSVFDEPKKYFLPSRSVEFSVPAPGTWSEDPISSSIYFLKFDTSRTTELYEFSSFNEFREANFKSLRPSFSLTGEKGDKIDLFMTRRVLHQTARISLFLSAGP